MAEYNGASSRSAGCGGHPAEPTVDVREMLCAQALGIVARAVERLPAGARLRVVYGAEDVKRDVVAWARDRGHRLVPCADGVVMVQRSG